MDEETAGVHLINIAAPIAGATSWPASEFSAKVAPHLPNANDIE
jgi:hypothetical protein